MDEAAWMQALAVAHADLGLVRARMRVFAEGTRVQAAEMLRARDLWTVEGLARLEDYANA